MQSVCELEVNIADVHPCFFYVMFLEILGIGNIRIMNNLAVGLNKVLHLSILWVGSRIFVGFDSCFLLVISFGNLGEHMKWRSKLSFGTHLFCLPCWHS